MILFINIYPILCNVILFFFSLRIIFLIFKMIDSDCQNLKHSKKIGVNILVFLSIFFLSGFYHFHFAYDVNDYYTEKSLALKSDFVEKIDSLELDFQLVLDAYSSLDDESKNKTNSKVSCYSFTKHGQKSHSYISDEFYSVLKRILKKEKFSKITFCSDSTFIYNLGNIHSSDFSDFEDKNHFTTHQLIYHPRGTFKEPRYYEMFVGSVDSILTTQWNYRIEKRWEYVW